MPSQLQQRCSSQPHTFTKGSRQPCLHRSFQVLNRRQGKPAMSPIHAATTPASTGVTAPQPCVAPEQMPIDFLSLKGVLFDIDGTLTNSDPLHFKAFQDMLMEVGFNGGQPIDEEFFRKNISGGHNPEIAARLFPEWSEERRREFYEAKEARYRSLAGSVLVPLAGLQDFMAWIDSRGLRKAAVTNAPRENAELMLKALGLSSYFETVVLGEECTRAKPYPDPYQQALQTLGLQPHEAVVIEDSPSGIQAGVAAGVPVVGLLTGQTEDALRKAGATLVLNDFRDVMQIIQQQTQQQQQQHR